MSPLSSCRKCRYWHGPANGWGQCRRHSPHITPIGTRWPDTYAGDSCGDFEYLFLTREVLKAAEEFEDGNGVMREQ